MGIYSTFIRPLAFRLDPERAHRMAIELGAAVAPFSGGPCTRASRPAILRAKAGGLLISGVELLAAAFVLMLGLVLFAGVWTGGIPGFLD